MDKDVFEGRKEIWAPIPGYEGMYDVSSIGRVRSYLDPTGFDKDKRLEEPELMKPQLHKRGYLYVTLRKDGKGHKGYINNLMGKAFIPNPENKPEVNHIDGIKTHNVLSNLEWNTHDVPVCGMWKEVLLKRWKRGEDLFIVMSLMTTSIAWIVQRAILV